MVMPPNVVLNRDGSHVFIGKHEEISGVLGDGKYHAQIECAEDQRLLYKFLNKDIPSVERQILIQPKRQRLPKVSTQLVTNSLP